MTKLMESTDSKDWTQASTSQMIQLTATLVRVAMSTFAGKHNPGQMPTFKPKEIELMMIQVSRSTWKAIPALKEVQQNKSNSARPENN